MAATIRDIARHAQVSITTVSRVLNDRPDVKDATREKVNTAIKELGYSPNIVARGLVLQRSNVIGFIVPDITNPSFPELARGIVNKARSYGYSVMFYDTNHDRSVEKEAIRLLRSKQVDGIILSFNEANKEELERLRLEHFPIVQIYRKSSNSVVPTIALDNIASGYKATAYLLSLGHTRIAHISTGEDVQSGSERLQGYRDALAEAKVPYDEQLVVCGPNTAESGKQCMQHLLALPPERRPSALFACHDLMAAGAYDAIYDANLRIPDDISVVGHDNNQIAELIHPKLTTVDTFKYALGEKGVDLLVEQILSDKPVNRIVESSTELIIRESAQALMT
ncbi:MAG: LacI family transcriptional regulator [Spirochaetia bacterium]|nr:LacI family transcriptional regulator [Spirochaetia bacterium]MCF7942409.1 LacI family transcriptional regulator [Spirochaetia bacterium]